MPQDITFATKGEIARTQVKTALAVGTPHGPVLIDASYGDEVTLRQWHDPRY